MILSQMPAATARGLALLALGLGAAIHCAAGPITYFVDQTAGNAAVSGFIQTDGTIGVLSTGNIVDWNLLLSSGPTSFDLLGPLSGSNSQVVVGCCVLAQAVSATATELLFDYDAAGFFIFQAPYFGAGADLVCFQGSAPGETCTPSTVSAAILNLDFPNQIMYHSGTQVIGTAAPEPSAPALLGLGLALAVWRAASQRQSRRPFRRARGRVRR